LTVEASQSRQFRFGADQTFGARRRGVKRAREGQTVDHFQGVADSKNLLPERHSRGPSATVDLPEAVMRTMDAQNHLNRVASKGPGLAQGAMADAADPQMHLEIENYLGYFVISAG
jgi:hypothetical protein